METLGSNGQSVVGILLILFAQTKLLHGAEGATGHERQRNVLRNVFNLLGYNEENEEVHRKMDAKLKQIESQWVKFNYIKVYGFLVKWLSS